MIPYSRQRVSEQDIAAVVDVLKSDFLTQGERVSAFERAIASYCAVPFALATCNATAALHLACIALGVNSKTRVWVAANSFVASANCARYCDAQLDFVDVEAETGCISTAALEEKLLKAEREGRLPAVLIVVHIAGLSCDMATISAMCKPRGIAIIEDACHAIGANYQGKPVGACEFSDCAVFSFHPVKPLTTGEGGMLVTHNEDIIERARLYCQHGIERRPENFASNGPHADWYYEQQVLGYNYRLSDIQSALGISQLKTLDQRIQLREALSRFYFNAFAGSPLRLPHEKNYAGSSWHLFPIRFSDQHCRDEAYKALRAKGYGVNIHYLPLPDHPYYRQQGHTIHNYPAAKCWGDTELSIPLHDFIDETMQEDIVGVCLNVANSGTQRRVGALT